MGQLLGLLPYLMRERPGEMMQGRSGSVSFSRSLPFAVLAAALILFSLAGTACRSTPPSKHNSTVAPISVHLPFGNPSDAGNDPNNRLVLREQFAASWNAGKRTANWVAWKLVTSDIGNTKRSEFYADTEIPTPEPRDYTRSGYDRGHLCPSKDRSDSPTNNSAVFTMLNIIPQTGDNNRGPWEKMEEFERSLALAEREVYIFAGGAGEVDSFKGVTVPAVTWKVIIALESGKKFPDGQERAQVFAAIMPNRDGMKQDRWQQYQVTVAEIERRTGYHFFRNSPVIDVIAKRMG
jgi:endonuclease G, mitochondrial